MMTVRKLASATLFFLLHHTAGAATYYLDSELGSDTWSGRQQAPLGSPATDGPWQSLSKLASITLVPGDIVQLQCGRKWNQSLKLKSSGTAAMPVTVRPISASCAVPPAIDGSQRIEPSNWVLHGGNIYKVSWPPQKISNSGLTTGVAGWTSWSAAGDQKLAFETACPASATGIAGCAGFTSSPSGLGSIAISNNFLTEGGTGYIGEVSLWIPVGARVKVLVRRGSPPYEPVSDVQWATGNGGWQKISMNFFASRTVSDARLDLEVPPATRIYFRGASLKPLLTSPAGAWTDTVPLLPAYHPNRGYDITRLGSVYAKVAADANTITMNNVTGSTYIDIDASLKLPSGVTPHVGSRLRIRSAPWWIDEVTITSVTGNRLNFTPVTHYPVKASQGYFLLDSLGFLDTPGEWFYDPVAATTYAWMPDNSMPGNRVRMGVLGKGIDLAGLSYIVIEGLDIRYTGTGADLTGTRGITLRNVTISDTLNAGVLATNASDTHIDVSRFFRTGGDAVIASGSTGLQVTGNDITESGAVMMVGGGNSSPSVWSLPAMTIGAIQTGTTATVTDNRLRYVSGNGIIAKSGDGGIERNAVQDSCLMINDCGGIYVNYVSPRTRIVSNLVERVSGNLDGMAVNARTHAIGIYLDDLSTGMQVTDNTISSADYGIQVHSAYNNQILRNLLHGNRNSQLWFHEQTNMTSVTGDVNNNTVSGNHFFPTTPAVAVRFDGEIGSLTDFGLLSSNRYSALFSPRLVSESWPGQDAAYTLTEWQAATGPGRLRQDVGSTWLLQSGYAAYLSAGGNIIPNNALQNGMDGWTWWNQTAPFTRAVMEACAVGNTAGSCLRMNAGGSPTLVSTPNFSVQQDQWYRVSFDAKTSLNGQIISAVVRRGGPAPLYERLMPATESLAGSATWQRYTFTFRAAKSVTANDPVTRELGARLDFEEIPVGQTLWVANVELVPLLPVESTLHTGLITNPGRTTWSVSCPDQTTNPALCSRYFVFPAATAVTWPVSLPPLGALSLYTVNQNTQDTDGDGVADSQDTCPATSAGSQVNAAGCALGQKPV